jgi:hypothetical protein
MNAPERRQAKWLMFTCILCMLVGPVLNGIFSVSGEGADNYRALKKGRDGVALIKFETVGPILQVVGAVIGLVSSVLFIFFLRAVASCFNSTVLVHGIHLYLLYLALLIGGTIQIAVRGEKALAKPEIVLMLGLGWLGLAVGYVLIIAATRSCIFNGLSRVRSPLAA